MPTFNYTGKKKITDQSIFTVKLNMSNEKSPEIFIDLKQAEIEKFGVNNHIKIEAYYRTNIQFFDLGEVGGFSEKTPSEKTLVCDQFKPWMQPMLRFKIVDMSTDLMPVIAYRNKLSNSEISNNGIKSHNFLNPQYADPEVIGQRAWYIDWNEDNPTLLINRDLNDIIDIRNMFDKDTENPEYRLLILPEFMTQALDRILLNQDRDEDNNYILKAKELHGENCPNYDGSNEIDIKDYINETVKKMTEKFNLLEVCKSRRS